MLGASNLRENGMNCHFLVLNLTPRCDKKKNRKSIHKIFFPFLFFLGGGDVRIEKKTNSQLLLELLILVSEITE